MEPEEREPSIERFIRLSLSVALAVLYMTLVVVTFIKLSLYQSSEGRQAIDSAWLGFWGSVVGGVLGLSGGLIAAYAAVLAVKQQLGKIDADRKLETQKQLLAYATVLAGSLATSIPEARSLVSALKSNDLKLSIRHGGNIFLVQRWIDSEMRAEWQKKAPTVAVRLTLFLAMVEEQKVAMERAGAFVASGAVTNAFSDRATVGYLRSVAATNTLVIGECLLLYRAMAQEVGELSVLLKGYGQQLEEIWGDIRTEADRLYKVYVHLGGNPDSSEI